MRRGLLSLEPLVLTALFGTFLWSCADGRELSQAVCVLFDESGTYADQREEAVRIVRTALLSKMLPGDHLIFGRIDSRSYERANLVAELHLEQTPSQAYAQKLAFLGELEAFAAREQRSRYTDLQGAMMLCGEHLADTGAEQKLMIVFSDLKEELPPGVVREMAPDQLRGIKVLAMNVKKLSPDNADPRAYRGRIDRFVGLISAAGAEPLEVIVAPGKLVAYLEENRSRRR